MRKKKNNNLVAIIYANGNGKTLYYTSSNRAGMKVGICNASVIWSCMHGTTLRDNEGNEITFAIVDGSEVKYKDINN